MRWAIAALVATMVAAFVVWSGPGLAAWTPAAPPVASAALDTCRGDVNGDGSVDVVDVILVGLRVGSRAGDRRYDPAFDLNANGRINIVDVIIVANLVGAPCDGTPAPTSTPAPSTDTPTATNTAAATASPAATNSPAPTSTPSHTATATRTATNTATASPTATNSPAPTSTPSHTATATASPTATNSPVPTSTPSHTATATFTATATNSPVPTSTPSHTATATFTATPTATSTETATASPTPTNSPEPTATNTAVPTATDTATATATSTASATSTATPTSTAVPTPTATVDAGLPPDPADVAPSVDNTVATDILSSTAFLYEGPNPIQTGVSPGTIELTRVAVLRGRVLDRANDPLPGVTISILGHPEFGETLSRSDGMFDIAVNGGGRLVIDYQKDGYLPSQRSVDAPWRDFAWAPDVVLVPLDTAVTTIDLTSPSLQTARGNLETDADGTRQATVLFPAGTTASLVMPDGSTQPISTLHIRATEYTVGANGPEAMPAELPSSVGYTYAVELSADEAIAAGANGVNFNQPLPTYTENFVGFPVGGAVPVGYYDRNKGQWIASPDGRVIKVVGVTGGLADLDITGDDIADDASLIGVSSDERARLATLYSPGQSLWRTPIQHFSAWDMNWPYGPPSDAVDPPPPDIDEPPVDDDPEEECGSIIGCQNQSLGQSLPLTGTSFQLSYRSERTPGRTDASILSIPLSGPGALPPSLVGIRAKVEVAGRQFHQSFAPAPNQRWSMTWDGFDAYGRFLQGEQTAVVTVTYDYVPQYYSTLYALGSSFGRPGRMSGDIAITNHRFSSVISLNRTWTETVGAWDARATGLGGWDLSVHHSYDAGSRTLRLGTGAQRSSESMVGGLTTLVQGLNFPAAVNAGADGSVYIADSGNNRILRKDPSGTVTTVAGNGAGSFSGDGGPATSAALNFPRDVAVAPDGSFFIADWANHRIRRVGPNGIITTVAGGVGGFLGDGGPATSARLNSPTGVAVAPDGSLIVADFGNNRVRRITTDGIISTIAGNGTTVFGGDGGPGTAASLDRPTGIAVAPDGTIYIGDLGHHRVRRLSPDGTITTVAGNGTAGFWGDGDSAMLAALNEPRYVALGSDGTLYISDRNNARVRHVDANGVINTIAGGGTSLTDGVPAIAMNTPVEDISIGPDGSLFIATFGRNRVYRVGTILPGVAASDVLLPSQDGRELYLFDGAGRHLRTLDALTGAVLLEFGYDSDGYLASITDSSGNVTAIERTGGLPSAIVAPGGQRTTLTVDPQGWLASAANPAGEAHTMTSSPEGLLQTFTDPATNEHAFTYDSVGRLVRDEDPAGGSTTLARTKFSNGFTVTTTTSLGRVNTYTVERLPLGTLRRTNVGPTGATTVSVVTPGAAEQTTFPNGGTASLVFGPDPRWGMLAPVTTNLTMTTPGGLTRTVTSSRTATLFDFTDPLSLVNLTETVTDAGNTRTRSYNATTRTFTLTTAEGRTSTASLDALGRMVSYQPGPGVAPIIDTYDAFGRLAGETQGVLSQSYAYDALHRLTTSTDGAGQATAYAYDSADRVIKMTTPGGHEYRFAYDANGNVSAITMPSGAVHSMSATAIDQPDTYTSPGSAGSTGWEYDLDRAWTRMTLPGGDTLDASYDSGARPVGRSYAEASASFVYGDATDRVASMSRTPSVGAAHTTAMTWDAELPTSMGVSGAATGQYSFGYDSRLLLTSMNLTSGADVANMPLARDRDGLITNYGPFTVAHGGPGAAVSMIGDGQLSVTHSYDAQGRLAQRRHVVAGTTVYQVDLSYNAAGAIAQRTETTGAGTEARAYTYDADGQLTAVTVGGSTVESYSYDANGNRSSSSAPATYDTQDRLTSLGGVSYAIDDDGRLTSRGADTFQYSTRGELIAATAGGQLVTYAYDAMGRRVSRTESAATTQYFYGNPSNALQLTASREPSGALTIYYYGSTGLFAMQRAGVRYYVASDQAGSPRVITDTTGAVVKTLQYDSYGQLLADSNPAFTLAIGYAGGIADNTTDLVHFGFRDYDPAAGRWTTRDPAIFNGGSFNLYAYVNGDPVNQSDPTGLWAFTLGASLYEGIGGGGSLTIGSDGFKVCAEAGIGVGGGIEAGLSESVGDTTLTGSLVLEASAKIGPLKAGVGYELSKRAGDKCVKGKGKVTLGLSNTPLEASLEFGESGLNGGKVKYGANSGDPGSSLPVGGVGLSAKAAGRVCTGMNW